MVAEQKQGLVMKQTLTNAELRAIERLTDACSSDEGLQIRLSWLQTRPPGHETNDFLYYVDDTLVGYLNVSSYGGKERELTGMVRPDYRRRGIFRSLLTAAKEECLHRGVQKLLLVCDHASASGLAFIEAIGARHDFSEYEMVLGTFHDRGSTHQGLVVRKAGADDAEALILIQASDFDGDVEQARQYVTEFLQQPRQQFYLALIVETPVGCLRLDEMDDEVGIYGFVVRPEYRGRGYGRQILEEVIRACRDEQSGGQRSRPLRPSKAIMLDVDTNNTNAIGLYLSCGFEVRVTYDYYNVRME